MDIMILQRNAWWLREKHPEMREGQSLMNAIYEYSIDIYNKISGTEYDCFYDDKIVKFFLEKVSEYLI